jgi:hypothetical protein
VFDLCLQVYLRPYSIEEAQCQPGYKPGPQHSELQVLLILDLSLAKPLIGFLFGVLAAIAVLLLEQTDHLVVLATRLFQIVVGELALSHLACPLISLPLALKHVSVHAYPPDIHQNELPARIAFLTLNNQCTNGESQGSLKVPVVASSWSPISQPITMHLR